MTSATKNEDRPATLADLHQPPAPIVDIAAHEADLARRAAEHEANQGELLRCLNPAYAAKRELEKPRYRFTVAAEWYAVENDEHCVLYSKQEVVAMDEAGAWAAFCDKIGKWPSRRQAKPTIKRGRQIPTSELTADARDIVDELPRRTIGPVARRAKH